MARKKRSHGQSKAPSKKVQTKEILNCGTNASYFINTYVKIPHPVQGMIKFNTFDFQDECLKAFQENREVIVNKSRQLGLSTICAAYALWMALFQKEKNVLIIATRLETAKLFIKKVRSMYQSLPSWLIMPSLDAESVRYLEFSNGSRIKAEPTSPDAGRGESLSLLIVDEAAHVDDIEDIWLGLQPTLSTGGSAILLSTPSGVGTLFHRIWDGAKNGKNNFKAIELPWTVHPERDEEWFEEQRKSIVEAKGERGVAQELMCSFTAAGDTFLRPDVMERLFKEIKEPIEKTGPKPGDDGMWIWARPKTEHRYILSADISRGNSDDFSAMHVIDMDDDEVVAEYKGKIDPDVFGDYIIDVANYYNKALVCPERNQAGTVTIYRLRDKQYPNLFYDKLHRNAYMAHTPVDAGGALPGFETNAKNRVSILAQLENVLRNQHLKVYSKRLFEELQTFVYKNNKPQAQKGYNDDLVMSLAIGNSLYEAGGDDKSNTDDMAKALLAGMSVNTNTLDPNTGKAGPSDQNNPQQQQSDVPPVMAGNSLGDFAEIAKNKSLKKHSVQNFNDPYWAQFKWLFED